MVQIDLLPDVKREFLKTQQTKRTVVTAAILISLVSIVALVLCFLYVQFAQPLYLKTVQDDIDTGIANFKKKPDAVKIVTVQGVLEQIPSIQNKKLIISRTTSYLSSFTPRDVEYSSVKLDTSANTITLSGATTSIDKAHELANNLKSAKFEYRKNNTQSSLKPFSVIVFKSLGKSSTQGDEKAVSFEISFNYDPTLFAEAITDQTITVNASSEALLLPTQQPFAGTVPNQMPGASQ